MEKSDVLTALLNDIVVANKILEHEGVLDAFGHVSARSPQDPRCMLLARNMAPALVSVEDVLEFDIGTGEPVDPDAPSVYLERYIHSEIYKLRPDVNAVVHSHADSLIPFGVSSAPLRPIYHMSSFLMTDVPVFEIRECAGEHSDLLIRSSELGAALAESFGEGPVVLMRGHGATIIGQNIRQAVFRAVYAQVNARLVQNAVQLGEPTYLTPGEALAATETNDGQSNRAWNYWKRRIGG